MRKGWRQTVIIENILSHSEVIVVFCFRPQENGGRQFELSSLASLEKELLSPEVVRNTRNQQDVNEEREMIEGSDS